MFIALLYVIRFSLSAAWLISISHAEIRSLDSDMQTLVYENYNKFIAATETIRQVSALCLLMGMLASKLCILTMLTVAV
jgi:hypothetical protein